MGFFSGADLAIAVSRAGGLGQIGAVFDMGELDTHLTQVSTSLTRHNGLLPVGVGLLPFITKLDEALPVLAKHKPAVVWLFAAPALDDFATWASRIRTATPGSQLWIQVGSVAAALHVAGTAKPDVICVQGLDAGGHGFEKGASLISLLPEVADALAQAGQGDIHLVAAGGITEGRSVVAALALGAQGVVMGTRFLAAPEIQMHVGYRAALLAAVDGGQSTVRCKLFDELRGPNIWPDIYDGRGLVTESFTDHAEGLNIDEVRRRLAEDVKAGNAGFGTAGKGRATVWAGTGVGLVTREQPAAEIVEEVRDAAAKVLANVKRRLVAGKVWLGCVQ